MTRRYVYLPSEVPADEVDNVPLGLVAHPMYPWRTDEHGRPTELVNRLVTRYQLCAATPCDPTAALRYLRSLPDRHVRFLLHHPDATAARLKQHYGDPLWSQAVDLARNGLVTLTVRADDTDPSRLGTLINWTATAPVRDRIRDRQRHEAAIDRAERRTAEAAATALACATNLPCSPDSLVHALRTAALAERPSPRRLKTLTAAANALCKGSIYGGIQQFSQHHFRDSKTINADEILDDAGVDPEIRRCLGIYRYGEISIGGPISIINPTNGVVSSCIGSVAPWTLSADPRSTRLDCHDALLIVVENKDPARLLALTHPEIATWFLSGYTGPHQLRMLAQLASTARKVIVVADADPDGVCIAAQVLAYVPTAHIVDLGRFRHYRRRRQPLPARRATLLQPLLDDPTVVGPLRTFAQAVYDRAYDIEQDDLTTGALDEVLDSLDQIPTTSHNISADSTAPFSHASRQPNGNTTTSAVEKPQHEHDVFTDPPPQHQTTSNQRCCPTCGHEPNDQHALAQHESDLTELWLEIDQKGGLAEARHCIKCQPHGFIEIIQCILCGRGPIIAFAASPAGTVRGMALVHAWLTTRGWVREGVTGWVCHGHQQPVAAQVPPRRVVAVGP